MEFLKNQNTLMVNVMVFFFKESEYMDGQCDRGERRLDKFTDFAKPL